MGPEDHVEPRPIHHVAELGESVTSPVQELLVVDVVQLGARGHFDDDRSSGPEDPPYFPQGTPVILDVFEDVEHHDDVDAGVGQRAPDEVEMEERYRDLIREALQGAIDHVGPDDEVVGQLATEIPQEKARRATDFEDDGPSLALDR